MKRTIILIAIPTIIGMAIGYTFTSKTRTNNLPHKNPTAVEQKPKILGFIDPKTKEVFNSEGNLLKGYKQTLFIINLLENR